MASFVLVEKRLKTCCTEVDELMFRVMAHLLASVAVFLLGLSLMSAHAGVMTREAMAQAFPAPLVVGEKDRDLPVWPIFRQELTSTTIAAYAFESQDFATIPGFSGTPFNLLIALDPNGQFMDVRVLSHHEPVFLEGLGEKPLFAFVEQYKALSLKQSIKIGTGQNKSGKENGANVYIDGVSKATASVRILNQTLLAASLKVARAKLGYSEGRDPDLVAKIRPDVFKPMTWASLQKAGLVHQATFKNSDIEKAFKDTAGEGVDAEAFQNPRDLFADVYVANLSVPTVGKNLLSPEKWAYLQQRLDPGDHALLILAKGRYPLMGEDFVRGTVPDRVSLNQQKLPIEIRDLDLDATLDVPPELADAQLAALKQAGVSDARVEEHPLNSSRLAYQLVGLESDAAQVGQLMVEAALKADRVLADNLSTGEPLPRIAPWRAGLSGVYRFDAWQARLGFDHAGAQRRVPVGSEPTAAYTLWYASVGYRQKVDMGTVHWFARLDNLSNALAYSATSILTSTVPGRVPLPGRSLKLGLQWQF